MNSTYNLYDFNDDNSCNTWLNETRVWRKLIHEDLQKHDKHLKDESESIRNHTTQEVNSAKETIINKIDNVVNSYIIPIKNTTEANKSVLERIWNRISGWNIK